MFLEQSMSQQVIINVGDESVLVDVEQHEDGQYSFRQFPKDVLDESYSGKPRQDKKSRPGYVPPAVIELRAKQGRLNDNLKETTRNLATYMA
jgi:hypothetical protein